MTIGIWILGDQLYQTQTALTAVSPETPTIFIESLDYVLVQAAMMGRRYHRQKLVLVWSAMRHFAAELRDRGIPITYYNNAPNFETPLREWVQQNRITELRVMTPNDRPFTQLIQGLNLPCQITLVENNHFLWTVAEFQEWAKSRKRLLMEDFYRQSRKRFNILMADDKPVGGQWNFDQENRKPLASSKLFSGKDGQLKTPPILEFPPDAITQAVIQQVNSLPESQLYGKIASFSWGVTRSQGLQVLDHFIQHGLGNFGHYQDAMVTGEATLWHSLLSPYLNLGLLHPLEVIQSAEKAYADFSLPLNSVEGFIRQIMGWREYMRGVYYFMADDYGENNWFQHDRPLPDFFWDAKKTNLNCLHQVLSQVEETGYAHHIQRLMILSNFALISGLLPQAVESWFHSAFIDSYDWVMQPNVIGMGLFADGGVLASKPYAASANYIHKMSDYCRDCVYDYKKRTGENACPFNFFYWDFLSRHREKLKSQGRMSFILKNCDRISPEEWQAIHQKAQDWHSSQEI